MKDLTLQMAMEAQKVMKQKLYTLIEDGIAKEKTAGESGLSLTSISKTTPVKESVVV